MADGRGIYDRTLDAVDRVQRSWFPVALIVAVIKRYSDDRASRQAALVTFYGFLSVFPLLLLLITIGALVFGEETLKHHLLNSVLHQFPVIGEDLRGQIHAVVRGNSFALAAAIIGLLWGSLGITNSLQAASAALWRRPRTEDPSLWGRVAKGLMILGVLAAVTLGSSVLTGLATNGVARAGLGGTAARAAAFAVVLAVNAAGYAAALRLLAPPGTPWRTILPGTAFGAVGWSAIQVLGAWLIGSRLAHATPIYGTFAVVLGLIFWINIGAQLFLYSTELNLVLARGEWPRSIRSSPPT